jgi:hypothetical protein
LHICPLVEHEPEGTAPGQPGSTEAELELDPEPPLADPEVDECEVDDAEVELLDCAPDVELLAALDVEPVCVLLEAAPELDSDEDEPVPLLEPPSSLLAPVCALLESLEAGASVPPSPTVSNVVPPHAPIAAVATATPNHLETKE